MKFKLYIRILLIIYLPLYQVSCTTVAKPPQSTVPIQDIEIRPGQDPNETVLVEDIQSVVVIEDRRTENESFDDESDAVPDRQQVTLALLDTAMMSHDKGDLEGAAATLERALRINPHDAVLWNRLAQIRLEQKQYHQAANMAAKSNSLAGKNADLIRKNHRIIEKANLMK